MYRYHPLNRTQETLEAFFMVGKCIYMRWCVKKMSRLPDVKHNFLPNTDTGLGQT